MSHPDEPVTIRDKRKIDPQTGSVRQSASSGPADGAVPDFSAAESRQQEAAAAAEAAVPKADALKLEELTRDLQRVQAEYANYRKRVDRDRVAVREQAEGVLLASLLPVLDDIQRAYHHGDLNGPFKAVADKLAGILDKLGLQPFGEVGDEFDPNLHEAVSHDESPDVERPTCTIVMRPGFKHGERLLRPAMVGVTDPSGPVPPDPAGAEPGPAQAGPAAADEPVSAASGGPRHAAPDPDDEPAGADVPPTGWHVPND